MASGRRSNESLRKSRRPATTPEARENQMISLAIDLAEKQIRDGTASSQVVTHYLKLGSSRERIEQERLAHEVELLKVKQDAIESQKRIESLYENAISAMRAYQGVTPPEENLDED